jgi:hypothetical protein
MWEGEFSGGGLAGNERGIWKDDQGDQELRKI